MILDRNECQKIVDRVINILGKNINIMDAEGVIIASGDRDRINTFHKGAKVTAEEKREIIIDNDNLKKFEGCRPGVNLPIYYNSEVLGVVGITGDPKDIKGYGIIVKELVELMIQETERRKFEFFQLRAVKNFAKEIIKDNTYEDKEILRSRAQLIGFDESLSRVVIVADICNFREIAEDFTEVKIQELKQEIVDTIYTLCTSKDDIVFNLSEDRFVIFKSLDIIITDYCNKVEKILQKKFSISMYMGIGNACRSIREYHSSYMIATKAVEAGRKLNPEGLIYTVEEYSMPILLKAVSQKDRERFLQSMSNIFESVDSNLEEMFATVKCFFENRMSMKETADAMFIHRNTVTYRINRFKELYNIDVTDPYYCMMIYVGIMLKKYEEFKVE